MKIVLTANEDSLYNAWLEFFSDGDIESVLGVELVVHRGSIFEVEADALVSPANSFGFMDGGIDAAYTDRFGPGLSQRLREIIKTKHHGELLVGQAQIVSTHD